MLLSRPDFLVIGAQKSGTTDLCHQLARHPGVWFSKPKELYFFCRDDVEVLPYPFFENFEEWKAFDWHRRRTELLEAYARKFEGAAVGQLRGEGTPFYLPSRFAAARVREVLPDVRIVAILRHPADRAYSAYWHDVKMRRATETFENHLRFERSGALAFGHYEEQLRTWSELFGRDRLEVILFEDYRRDRSAAMSRIYGFLGLDPAAIDTAGDERRNEASVPRFPRVQRMLNQALRFYRSYWATIEYETTTPRAWPELAATKTIRGLGRLNLGARPYPPMNPTTRARLDDYYRRRNQGLAALLGRDLHVWGW
jgi:hypothetical protein